MQTLLLACTYGQSSACISGFKLAHALLHTPLSRSLFSLSLSLSHHVAFVLLRSRWQLCRASGLQAFYLARLCKALPLHASTRAFRIRGHAVATRVALVARKLEHISHTRVRRVSTRVVPVARKHVRAPHTWVCRASSRVDPLALSAQGNPRDARPRGLAAHADPVARSSKRLQQSRHRQLVSRLLYLLSTTTVNASSISSSSLRFIKQLPLLKN